jgi:hypothetical protein
LVLEGSAHLTDLRAADDNRETETGIKRAPDDCLSNVNLANPSKVFSYVPLPIPIIIQLKIPYSSPK